MKILYITTVGITMNFFKDFIQFLLDKGNVVDIACNVSGSDVPEYYGKWGCEVFHLSCTRSPLKRGNLRAIKEIKKLVEKNDYDIVHCHTPIAAACTRVACRKIRKKGRKIFYTAHGFHFYEGASLKNWLIYFPVEWILAHWTDVLITINIEDYMLAQKLMKAKQIKFVHGVGIDIEKFNVVHGDVEKIRTELNVSSTDIMLISVGELSSRKNHEVVIRAIKMLQNPGIQYFICGTGELEGYLDNLIKELGLCSQVKLLGFRTDILTLCQAADLFVFPSHQEGLPVALMEAIACHTPVICSQIRGNRELVDDYLFCETNVDNLVEQLSEVIKSRTFLKEKMKESVESNFINLKSYDIHNVIKEMMEIYLFV